MAQKRKEKELTINDLNTSIEELVLIVKKSFDEVDKRFNEVDKRFNEMDKRLDNLDKRLTKIEATMVTKEYLDDKLADLKGDLTVLMRKEDSKLKALVEILARRKVITEKDKETILRMEPFPDLGLHLGL